MRALGLWMLLLAGCHKPERLLKIDIHAHFPPAAAERTLRLMDDHGIDAVVNLSGGVPGQGLEENLAVAARHPGRIFVFANVNWAHAESGPGYGAKMAEDLMLSRAMGAKGLKIFKALGLGHADFAGKIIPVDAPELDPLFEKAGELGMPVAIHTGDPVAFWKPATPDNERYAELSAHPGWAEYGRPVPSWEELFAALERRVARHPKTTFLSVHFGNAPEYPERVAALLAKYPNLFVDTAARIPEIGRKPPAQMHDLFTRFADRIVFGTDLQVGPRGQLMLGSGGLAAPGPADVERFFSATWRYFETRDVGFDHPTPIQGAWTISGVGLDREVLQKVYGGNALKLLGVPAAQLGRAADRR